MAAVTAPGSAPMSTVRAGQAWTASRCSGTPRSAQIAAASATGWITPVRLLAQIRLHTRSPGRMASSKALTGTRPALSTASVTTSQPCRSSASIAPLTAGCSSGVVTMRPAARVARPKIAMLSASEAPPVNTTSVVSTPSAPAAAAARAASGRGGRRGPPNGAPRRCRSARGGTAAWPPRPRRRRAWSPRGQRRGARPEPTYARRVPTPGTFAPVHDGRARTRPSSARSRGVPSAPSRSTSRPAGAA